ncbi:type II toxin-antitoxin system mRNA interferase toxin, RelE/StbE family [Patescibacteria group bacterium]|nr:type II toxin-antitoxin system mRNA interferase toxin, RelE/StbE family [Patescibacteria group bacterium]
MKILYHPRFKKAYKKLSFEIKIKAEEKETLFRKNPFDSRLDTHKLHGKLKNQWSFSIDKKYRILLEFDKADAVFLDIGDHGLYK